MSGSFDELLKGSAKLVTGAVDAGFDGLGCTFEDGGDFSLGQSFVGGQDEGLTQFLRESGESLADGFGKFLRFESEIGSRFGGFEIFFEAGIGLRVLRVEGNLWGWRERQR